MPSKYTITPEFIERFHRKTDNSGGPGACWLWRGSIGSRGYGAIRVGSQMALAHRIAYLVAHGTLPDDLQVCHECDNRLCVNPAHLWLGTNNDNVADMWAKGRHPGITPRRGALNVNAKLTEADIRAIRHAYAEGGRQAVATAYGISYQNLWAIVTRRTWKHVD